MISYVILWSYCIATLRYVDVKDVLCDAEKYRCFLPTMTRH